MKARPLKISDIPRYNGQIVHQRNGGDLFVERVGRIGDAQARPNLGSFAIERKNAIGELREDGREPVF